MNSEKLNQLLDEIEKMMQVQIEMDREKSNEKNYHRVRKEQYFPARERLKNTLAEILKVTR